MAATKAQRIGIWIIAVFMLVGSIGLIILPIFVNDNQAVDQAKFNEISAQYQADYEAYQEKVDAQAAELSATYYPIFSPYQSRVAAFDKGSVTELGIEDLVLQREYITQLPVQTQDILVRLYFRILDQYMKNRQFTLH